MKKLQIFTLVVIILSSSVAYSQFINPCPADIWRDGQPCLPYSQLEWRGILINEVLEPKQQQICLTICNQYCCFTVHYFDRRIICREYYPSGPIKNIFFDLDIKQIDYDWNCTGCVFQNESMIMDMIITQMYDIFSDSLLWDRTNDGNEVYKTGRCVNQDEPCSDLYCCAKFVSVTYDEYGEMIGTPSYGEPYLLISVPPLNLFKIRYCNELPINRSDCHVDCNGALLEPSGSFNCTPPCNYGNWTRATLTPYIDYPSCGTNCKIIVNYQYRVAMCENVEYYDYKLDDISFTSGCDMSCIDNNFRAMFAFALSELLKNGKHPVPNNNECIDNYRAFTHTCYYREPNSNKIIECHNSGCCWRVFRLCKFNNVLQPPIPIDGPGPGEISSECDVTHACTFICDLLDVLPRVGLNENDIDLNDKVYGNVKIAENVEITIFTPKNINEKASIEIMNIKGQLIHSEVKENTDNSISYIIDKKIFSSGAYLFVVKNGTSVLYYDKFAIIK